MYIEIKKIQIKQFPEYSIDNCGNVYGFSGKKVSLVLHNKGYHKFNFWCCKNKKYYSKYIHRIMIESFFGEIPKHLVVNHINGIKTDNRLCNLELLTNAENRKHAIENKLMKYGENLPYTKILDKDVLIIRELYQQKGMTAKKLANKYCCSIGTIYDIVSFRSRVKFN